MDDRTYSPDKKWTMVQKRTRGRCPSSSEIAQETETSSDCLRLDCNGKSLKETCGICFEEIDAARMFSIEGCLHRYCISCMKQHVEVKLLSGRLAQCPHGGCNSEVNIDSLEILFAPKLVKIMNQRIEESSIPVRKRVYCQYPKCSAVMSKKDVLIYTRTFYLDADQSGARKCMKCHYYFCINCMVPYHFGITCAGYKKSNTYPSIEDQLLNSLARKKQWRKCAMCKHMVELAQGCNHIICRCGYEFCYSCGAEWEKRENRKCRCPRWDDFYIIREPQPRQRDIIGRYVIILIFLLGTALLYVISFWCFYF